MPKPLVEDVYVDARSRLHDPGGITSNQWSDAVLQPHYQRAYRKMYDGMNFGSNRIRREWYFILPAFTSVLDPFGYDITDMAEPEMMEDRDVGTQLNINAFSNTVSGAIQLNFSTPHGLGSSSDVIVQDVPVTALAAIGRWYITVIDPNNISLNGSLSTVSGGPGGFLSFSSTKFYPVDPIDGLSDRDITSRLVDYTWEEEKFKFRGATVARQLHVQYIASGNPPTNIATQLGIDNCVNFLGTATAGYAAESAGWYQMADRYLRQAFGPKGEADASGGMLRDLINIQVLKMQRKQKSMGPFRKPRLWNSQPWY